MRLVFGTAAGVPPVARGPSRAAVARRRQVNDLRPTRTAASARRCGLRQPRTEPAPAEGARARPRRPGHAAAGAPVALARLPRPTPKRRRGERSSRWSTRRWRRSWPPRPAYACPPVVTAALGPNGDALIATRQPDITPLEELPPRAGPTTMLLEDLWEQVVRLHAAGISHGRLNLEQRAPHRRRPDAGRLLRCDARRAAIGAGHRRRRVARWRARSSLGRTARWRKAVEAGWGDAIARVLPVPAAGGAHAAPARPRAHTRGRLEGAAEGRRGRRARRCPRSSRSTASSLKDVGLMVALVRRRTS